MNNMVSLVFTKEVDGVVDKLQLLTHGGFVRSVIRKYEEQGYICEGVKEEEVNVITLP